MTVAMVGRKVRWLTGTPYLNFFVDRLLGGEGHESRFARTFLDLLGDIRSFADVGSHFGLYSCLAALQNPALKINGFDISSKAIQVARAVTRENQIRNVRFHHLAVAGGMTTIRYTPDDTRSGLLNRVRHGGTVSVPAKTLDQIFPRQVAPQLIKIDVEGSELDVLKGAARLMAETRPILMIEVHPVLLKGMGAAVAQIEGLLDRHRYSREAFDKRSGVRLSRLSQTNEGMAICRPID